MTIALRADSQALQVGEVHLQAGRTDTIETLVGSSALIFLSGEAQVVISGCAHVAREGDVEIVCLGEPCTIAATRDVHVYVVVAKGANLALGVR